MHASSAVSGAANDAVHQVAPWIEKLARLGYFAKALLYMTIGALATLAALRLGGTVATGSRGAMATLLTAPFGRLLIAVIAVGLFGYAAWRVVEAIVDPERDGHGAKGIVMRIRSAVIGMLHFALAVSAVKILSGNLAAGNDGAQTQSWTARALATPGGKLVLWAVAGGFVVYGLYQLYCAWQSKLDKRLALGQLSVTARRWIVGASRFGIAARGVVFAMTGVLIARAVRTHDPSQARGLKASLMEVLTFGRIPFALIATGLIAYGVYQLINARYRRIAVA